EDNESERSLYAQLLRKHGFNVQTAENADKAIGYADEAVDVVLSDLHMGDVSGIDLLQLWKKRRSDTQFVLVTGHSSVDTAVEAIKAGAFDYITKPINPDELVLNIRRAIDFTRKDQELDNLRRRLDESFSIKSMIGQSQRMREIFTRIERAAAVDSTVLILGESGTGKELVAQALHQNSPRSKGPFVAVNCAAVPATLVESELFGHVKGAFTGATDKRMGRFEQANGGTLFIDEIGDFELGLQAKLLRVLETLQVTPVGGHEERKVDVRVVAATSRDILKMVAEGTFREDLYYRLNVVTVTLPPLRERTDDIPLLVDHFIRQVAKRSDSPPKRVSAELMRRFEQYRWPGNVRELKNTIESMLVLSDGTELTVNDLPERMRSGVAPTGQTPRVPADLTMEQLERLAIEQALDLTGGNRTHAAQR
ncbi:MAG TPA: sigma-54 dependent transcriptional regulator, partial [Tepidisphaeraceae bacterium]|nr:sigma-54 dependent transcriptional regulator [Tepidisphaeraceae bacterium]